MGRSTGLEAYVHFQGLIRQTEMVSVDRTRELARHTEIGWSTERVRWAHTREHLRHTEINQYTDPGNCRKTEDFKPKTQNANPSQIQTKTSMQYIKLKIWQQAFI